MANKLETYEVGKWTVLGRTIFKPPFKVTDSLINEARIVHVVKGRSRLYSANQFSDLGPGDTFIMKADNFVNNWLENEDDALNEVIVFQINSDFLRALYEGQLPEWFLPSKTNTNNAVATAEAHPLISTLFENLQVYLNHPGHLKEGIIQLKIKELVSILVQTDTSGDIRKIFANLFQATSYDFQEVIQQNLFEDLGIEDLAFLTGMSLSSFKRKFSSLYGTSPNKYIISKRLEKAQTLLRTTTLRISEIAYDCGFSDVGYFSKTFKSYYKCSPSEVRKNKPD